MTGKTVLANLLALYAVEHSPDTTTVFICWQTERSHGRHNSGWKFCIFSALKEGLAQVFDVDG
jgi:hypothetical protein